jgi:hypothetical protein
LAFEKKRCGIKVTRWTHAPQQKSFDNVISAGKQCRRQFETERLSSLKIDEQLNFCGLLINRRIQ